MVFAAPQSLASDALELEQVGTGGIVNSDQVNGVGLTDTSELVRHHAIIEIDTNESKKNDIESRSTMRLSLVDIGDPLPSKSVSYSQRAAHQECLVFDSLPVADGTPISDERRSIQEYFNVGPEDVAFYFSSQEPASAFEKVRLGNLSAPLPAAEDGFVDDLDVIYIEEGSIAERASNVAGGASLPAVLVDSNHQHEVHSGSVGSILAPVVNILDERFSDHGRIDIPPVVSLLTQRDGEAVISSDMDMPSGVPKNGHPSITWNSSGKMGGVVQINISLYGNLDGSKDRVRHEIRCTSEDVGSYRLSDSIRKIISQFDHDRAELLLMRTASTFSVSGDSLVEVIHTTKLRSPLY